MDLATLSVFRAVAAELSVTRAAQRLGRVPSNVTTRIQQLEEELGVALFERDRKRFALTAEGERFLDYVERILNLSEEARQVLRPGSPSGVLRVGSMESTVASRLPPVLAGFSRQWPAVTLDLDTGPSRQLIEGVLRHRFDCAFLAVPLDERWQDAETLERERVFSEELVLILPPGHRKVSGPDDVEVRTLAAFGPGCTYRALAEDWLARSGAQGPAFRVHDVKSYHAIVACVSAGSCVGVVPRSVLDLNRAMAPVEEEPLATADTFLVWRRGAQTPALQAFRETVAAFAGG